MRHSLVLALLPLVLITKNAKCDSTKPLNNSEARDDSDRIDRKIKSTPEMILPSGGRPGEWAYMHYDVNALKNRTLRIIVPMIEPPYVNYINISEEAEKESGHGPGVVMEILREVAKQLNLQYEIVMAPDQEWGALDNGVWTGAFGQLFRGEADVLAGAAIMQADRSLITDLTYPFQYELTGMMIRSPEKYTDNTLLIVTEPFKWEVSE